MDLYAQELKVWKECKGLREEQQQQHGKVEAEQLGVREAECKVPGAFEW